MIVKIILKIEDETRTMMFGNSYKNWQSQFAEYCRICKQVEIISVQSSPSKWISWGGLKWCKEDLFQYYLNREGCQENDLDNQNPRKYEAMNFGKNKIAFNMANKIARIYY